MSDRITHDLKCHPEFFDNVENGRKPFELRKNDRGFKVGDLLRIREWCFSFGCVDMGFYSGREVLREVTYITDFPMALLPGYVCMGLRAVGGVVHCKQSPFDVLIDRTTPWGNPFIIGRDGTRSEVIAKYEDWIKTQPELIAALPELRGKVLGC